ncbi:MAG: hypothetical protein A2Y88_12980 [Chloroflexi bacterium RBG_13_48_10]|nr:MAG: hypothetical protein A2Y88_12980 [Chloroflexi bacterium RBG_13_48_10]
MSVTVAEGRNVQVGRGVRVIVLVLVGVRLGMGVMVANTSGGVIVGLVDGFWIKFINANTKKKIARINKTSNVIMRGERLELAVVI